MTLLAPTSLVAASAAAAVLFLAWAWHLDRGLRPGVAWRRGALVVVAVGLFLLVAQPARRQPVDAAGAAILTAGARAEALTELKSDRVLGIDSGSIYALPGAPAGLGEAVSDVAELARRRPEVKRWLVAGTGLSSWQLAALPGTVEFAAPADPVPGFDRIRWRRRIALGEPLEVEGSVALPGNEPAMLRLVGPAGVEAGLELVGETAFSVAAVPREAGRFPYRLELEIGAGPVASEIVDVEVVPPRLPRLLWIEGSPSFESREVKTWLRDSGGALVVRSRISRGRFRYDYLNHERIEVGRLGPGVVGEFDLLVIDGPAWSGLARAERTAVAEAVRGGLGLVLVPPLPAMRGGTRPPALFAVERVAGLDALEVELEGAGAGSLAPLTLEPRFLEPRSGQRTLLQDGAGRALAVDEPSGLGQVAATVVTGTYRWPLRGEALSHRHYWSRLLAAVARPSREPSLRVASGPVLVDRPTRIELVADAELSVTLAGPEGEGLPVALAQDPLEPRRWQATIWPRSGGWHRLVLGRDDGGDEPVDFYVTETAKWASWQQRQAHTATSLRSALGPAALPVEDRSVPRRLPVWPVFVLLLLAWGTLWADEQWRAAPAAR